MHWRVHHQWKSGGHLWPYSHGPLIDYSAIDVAVLIAEEDEGLGDE